MIFSFVFKSHTHTHTQLWTWACFSNFPLPSSYSVIFLFFLLTSVSSFSSIKSFLLVYLIQIHIWTLRPPSPMFLHNLLITVVTVALKPCKPVCVCTRVCNSQRLDRNCHNLTFSCKANFFFFFLITYVIFHFLYYFPTFTGLFLGLQYEFI